MRHLTDLEHTRRSSTKSVAKVDALKPIESHYRSGNADLGQDFFAPCLRHCLRYRRAVGYFSSSALVTWAEALSNIIEEDGATVSFLVSPNLSEEDVQALSRAIDEEEKKRLRSQVVDDFVARALDQMSKDELSKWRLELFSWMVANDRLTLRFAFPRHVSEATLFHEKIGIFAFPDGERIAFTGSANETYSGYHGNYESIDVYRSWIASDQERVQTKIEQFDEAWAGKAKGLDVESLSMETLRRVQSAAPPQHPPAKRPAGAEPPASNRVAEDGQYDSSDNAPKKWRHQDEAIEVFLEEKRGILEMATGTGKTRTALRIMDRLFEANEIDSVVVTTRGNDLLKQWQNTLDEWFYGQGLRIQRHYGSHHDVRHFARSPNEALLVVSRSQLPKLFERLGKEARRRMLIVHDEAHGLGAPSLVENTKGEHESFAYTLGLTATPEREYDEEGNAFIESEIGGVIYEFGLTKAIERGILCEFDYVPLEYDLTEGDRQRLRSVYSMKKAREEEGDPMSNEELARNLSLVYKTADQKPQRFAQHVAENLDLTESTIVFTATKEYGSAFLEKVHDFTYRYRTYYGEDEEHNLQDFIDERIDILITCHKISEGIDVPGLRNVVLGSSRRARLETIQRIGRCLRTDPDNPDKRATVVDFICVKKRDPEREVLATDAERRAWLSELSETEQKE